METVALAGADMRKAYSGIADHVASSSGEYPIAVVGIADAGVTVAKRAAYFLQTEFRDAISRNAAKEGIPVGTLNPYLYRDDHALFYVEPKKNDDDNLQIDGCDVFLVDSVIYRGRTARAALDALMDYGRPRRIMLATVVDRVVREMPIHPDYSHRELELDDHTRLTIEEGSNVDGSFDRMLAEHIRRRDGVDRQRVEFNR